MSMQYDFDKQIDRRKTDCYKWDDMGTGRADMIAMWVADMDFACAPAICEAVRKRAEHPVYGYPVRTEYYFDAVKNWLEKRHGFTVKEKDLVFSPPGVIYAMNTALKLVTEPGDKVMVHTPNYGPLYNLVIKNGRELVESPLVLESGSEVFRMDYADLEKKAAKGVKAFLITNPHNPTGRVFSREELEKLAEICLRYGIYMLVDEIHADFVSKSDVHPHIAFSTLGEAVYKRTVICYSANKGFNLGGFQMSSVIIGDYDLRQRFLVEMDVAQTRLDNIFGAEALVAAYNESEDWLDQAISYVDKNKDYLDGFASEHIPQIRVHRTEGTYFGWLDCSKLGMSGEQLDLLFREKAGVAMSPGTDFGAGYEQFFRINLACPKELLTKALERIKSALEEL